MEGINKIILQDLANEYFKSGTKRDNDMTYQESVNTIM